MRLLTSPGNKRQLWHPQCSHRESAKKSRDGHPGLVGVSPMDTHFLLLDVTALLKIPAPQFSVKPQEDRQGSCLALVLRMLSVSKTGERGRQVGGAHLWAAAANMEVQTPVMRQGPSSPSWVLSPPSLYLKPA